jgi:hypothetical protein
MAMKVAKVFPRHPMELPRHTLQDIYALKAVNEGKATPEQQIMFMQWLKRDVCGIGAISFTSAGERESNMNEGQRTVAVYLQRFIDEPIDMIKQRLGLKRNIER